MPNGVPLLASSKLSAVHRFVWSGVVSLVSINRFCGYGTTFEAILLL